MPSYRAVTINMLGGMIAGVESYEWYITLDSIIIEHIASDRELRWRAK
jgi:hypothetical protein